MKKRSTCIEVLHPGLYTTIQDMGRHGYQAYGISPGGWMDPLMAVRANHLAGNPNPFPLLEFYLMPPRIKALTSVKIAYAALTGKVQINGRGAADVVELQAGEVWSVRGFSGSYGYLAIEGLMEAKKDFNSYSHHQLAGLGEKPLRKKQKLTFVQSCSQSNRVNARIKNPPYNSSSIKVSPGPEYALLSEQQRYQLLRHSYHIRSSSNRMSRNLHGDQAIEHTFSIISSAVTPGTVQLPPEGHPIILGRDAQTTGGYPRVLIVHEDNLPIAYQKKPEEKLKFTF